MSTINSVRVKYPDTQKLSDAYLLEAFAKNVYFDDGYNLEEKMPTKSDKSIYGDKYISLGRIEDEDPEDYSLALGNNVSALGMNASAFGANTIATGGDQMVLGHYNIEDTKNTYAFIIGNGTSETRKNALSIQWDGTVQANKYLDSAGKQIVSSIGSLLVGKNTYETAGAALKLEAGDHMELVSSVVDSDDDTAGNEKLITIKFNCTLDDGGEAGEYLKLTGGTLTGGLIINPQGDHATETALVIQKEKNKLKFDTSSIRAVTGDTDNLTALKLRGSEIELINGNENGFFIFPSINSGGVTSSSSNYGECCLFWGNNVGVNDTYGMLGYTAGFGQYNYFSSLASYSFVEGRNNTIDSHATHIEGGYNSSLSLYGANPKAGNATSVYMHIEGYYNYAIGSYSHIEGKGNLWSNTHYATDEDPNLENIYNDWYNVSGDEHSLFALAFGEASHVEGNCGLALGDYSHVEGEKNLAYDEGTHVEGVKNLARGIGTHVEGVLNTSIGVTNHVEGHQCSANGKYNHIGGEQTTSVGDYNYLTGYQNEINGDYNAAFGSSNAIVSSNKSTIFSHNTSIEQINSSIIMGENLYIDTGNNIINFGFGTQLNENVDIDTILTAKDNKQLIITNSSYTLNEGLNNLIDNNTKGIITGELNYSKSANYDHMVGYKNYNKGSFNHIEGRQNLAEGVYNYIEGHGDTSYFDLYADSAFTLTYEKWNETKFQASKGNNNKINGYNNLVVGNFNAILGEENYSQGNYNFIFGKNNITENNNSYGIGHNLSIKAEHQLVVGRYNEEVEDAIFIIGNGDETARSNAVTVSSDGTLVAADFKKADGTSISGGELPLGTIITNQSETDSGMTYGSWRFLGKQTIPLTLGSATVNVTMCYWKRTDEKYTITGSEITEGEVFTVTSSEISSGEVFSIN